MSKYGYNCLRVNDTRKLLDHSARLQPPAMLFYTHQGGMAAEFGREHPHSVVIQRDWPDDKLHLEGAPSRWLDRRSNGVPESVYLYTTNEPGWSNPMLEWHLELMRLAVQRGRRLALLNLSVGTPNPEDWNTPLARDLVKLASAHPDLFVIGLHEYAGGVITSGLIGGNPGRIQRAAWPSPDEAATMTRWHVGRHKFLLDHCRMWGIPPPRIVITEAGFDHTGDIGAWLQGLKHTAPYTSINGWKTLVEQWRAWWPNWDAQTAYAEQLLWAEKALWNTVEAVLLFGWGDSGGWAAYDVSQADTLHKRLEGSAPQQQPQPQPQPVPQPVPKPGGTQPKQRAKINDKRNLRTGYGEHYPKIGVLVPGVYYTWLPMSIRKDDKGQNWAYVELDNGTGGWFWTDGLQFENYVETPPPPERTPHTLTINLSLTAEEKAALQAALEIIRASKAKIELV